MPNKDYNLKITYNGDSDSLERDKKLLEDMVALRNELARKVQIVPDGEEDRLRQMVLAQQRLTEEINKQRDSNNKRQVEEQKELGIIGQLIVEQKKLKQSIKDATSIEDLKKFQVQLEKNKKTQKELNSLAKESTNTFGSALTSFQFKFNALGQAIGQLAVSGFMAITHSVKDFAKESIQAFLEAELNAKKLEIALTNIGGEGGGAFEKLIKQSQELQKTSIFSDDDIQKSQTALIQYGLTSDQVQKLIPQIIDLASAQGTDLVSATETSIKAINGQTKGLKTAGIAFTDTGTRAGNLAKLTENLNKFQGQSSAVLDTNAGKVARLKNAYDDLLEGVGEELVNFATGIGDASISVAEYIRASFQGVEGYAALALQKVVEVSRQIDKELLEREKRTVGALLDDANKQTDSFLRKRIVSTNELVKTELEIRKTAIADGNKIQEAESNQIIQSLTRQSAAALEVLENRRDRERADNLKEDKDKIAKAKDLSQEIRIIKAEEIQQEYARQRALLVENARNRTEDVNNEIASRIQKNELIVEIEKKLKLDIAALNQKEQDEVEKKQDEELEALNKQYKEKRKEKKDLDKDIEKDNADFFALELKAAEDQNKAIAEAEKKKRQERAEAAKKVFDEVAEAEQKASDKRIANIDKEISAQEKNVAAQQSRAEQGLSNTLELEQKKSAELQAQREKEFQEEKIRQKTLAYFSLFAGYSKEGPASEALSKTARDIVISEAVTLAFAEKGGVVGEMAETTTLTGGSLSRSHKSGKDQIIVAEEGEGMLSLDRMNKLGGSAGFNKLAHLIDGGYMTDGVMFERQPIITAVPMFHQNSKNLERKIDTLIEVTKNKPVSNTSLDKDMNVIIETIEGNNRRLIKKMSKQPGFRK